jgi:cellulose synthase/poly-beta-1,6-N-acetylglucosamine synthase-like glycosyltransferase
MRAGPAELSWRLALVTIIASLGASIAYVAYDSRGTVLQPLELLVWGTWMSVQLLAFGATAAHALDGFLSTPTADDNNHAQRRVKVSVHIPIHREPPQIVAATLRGLAALDYSPFEVIIVDNNTPEEALWRPIEQLADQLGFRFFHLESWPGYKAGALNFANAVTCDDADFVAVLDADYIVRPDFLSRLTTHFHSPEVAFVQAPQDYRCAQGSVYQRCTFLAYRHFFDVNLAAHRRLASVIFVGTMGIIRKSVLDQCGGWDQHCLTEDAEMGLRAATNGYIGIFVNTSYGKGLMPLDYISFRRQRYRWALGGAQIFRKYWSQVFWVSRASRSRKLRMAQRLGFGLFLLYWFEPWLTVATMFLFWLAAVLYDVSPEFANAAIPANCAALAIGILSSRAVLFIGSLMRRSQCSFLRACGASMILSSVNWLVSRACAKAFWSKLAVFERTPKDQRSAETVIAKLRSMKPELALSLCGFAATFLAVATGVPALFCIGCVLGCAIFSLPLMILIIDHRYQPNTIAIGQGGTGDVRV